MPHDPAVDAYIDRQAAFAQPILRRLRALVHASCPEAVEAIKWGMPFFMLDGRPLANMAAFKAHSAFGFWKSDSPGGKQGEGMGQLGRLAALADLPDDATLMAMIEAAAARLRMRAPEPRAVHKPPLAIPDDLAAALAAAPAADAGFAGLPAGARREYVEWIAEAKRPETRAKRVAQAAAQAAEGKKLNWRYERG